MAGMIPQSFIDDLLARADIVDVIDSRVTLKKTGKNYSGLCPFHQEKSPSFSVEPDKQFYYCFGCGAGGNALGFLMSYENLDFPQAIEALAGSMGIEVPREESPALKQEREKNQGIYEILEKAAAYYQTQLRQHPEKKQAVDYLKRRGLSGEIARDFGLGFAPSGWQNLLQALGEVSADKQALLTGGMLIENPDNKRHPIYDRFRKRIMFPIRDARGRVIAFGGRVLDENDNPKYLNSPETPVFHKGEELYGLYEARKKVRKLERVLIVEGYMDVIALAQHDIPYCVATLGTATSSRHLQRLFKLVPEVVFCFDGDKAGRDAAWRALQQAIPLMEDGRSARFLFLPDGEDPDSQVRKIGSQTFIRSIGEATQLAEFFFETLGSQVDMKALEGRARLSTLALPYIRQFPQGVLRQLLLDQLARITGVERQTLDALHKESKPVPAPPAKTSHADPRPPQRPPVQKNPTKSSTHTACMKAVNFIILQPEIINKTEISPELSKLKHPDIDLLLQVVELAKRHPSSTTAELLGRIYASPLGSQLVQLLDREQITPREGIETEFREIVQHLNKALARKIRQDTLIMEAREKLNSGRASK